MIPLVTRVSTPLTWQNVENNFESIRYGLEEEHHHDGIDSKVWSSIDQLANVVLGSGVSRIVLLTWDDYIAYPEFDADTLYLITDSGRVGAHNDPTLTVFLLSAKLIELDTITLSSGTPSLLDPSHALFQTTGGVTALDPIVLSGFDGIPVTIQELAWYDDLGEAGQESFALSSEGMVGGISQEATTDAGSLDEMIATESSEVMVGTIDYEILVEDGYPELIVQELSTQGIPMTTISYIAAI